MSKIRPMPRMSETIRSKFSLVRSSNQLFGCCCAQADPPISPRVGESAVPFKSRAVGRIHGCLRQRRHRRETRPRLERADSALQPELLSLDDSRLKLAVKKSPPKRAKTIHHTESILRRNHSFCEYDEAMMYSRIPCRTQSEAEPTLPFDCFRKFRKQRCCCYFLLGTGTLKTSPKT